MPNIELNVTEDSPVELSVLSDSLVRLGVQEQINATYNDPSPALKQAFLQLAEHISYIDADGQDYYDALYDALYPVAISSITAVYTQSGTVYDTTPLDDLKPDLVVTANYSDGTSETVSTYTLSGTLTVGTSTITVTYMDKTATFTVNVTLDREAIFGAFSNGYAAVKSTSGVTNGYTYRQAVAARACPHDPVSNNNYTFTVTDSSKYNLAVYGVLSLEKHPLSNTAVVDGYGYPNASGTPSWSTSGSTSAAYVWLALKKMDGTAFTGAELANGAEAVFTYS